MGVSVGYTNTIVCSSVVFPSKRVTICPSRIEYTDTVRPTGIVASVIWFDHSLDFLSMMLDIMIRYGNDRSYLADTMSPD
jgi:hypothetical protein